MNIFLTSNKWQYRLGRTIVQAIVGFIFANVDIIITSFNIDGSMKALIVGIVMCILSPVMRALGIVGIRYVWVSGQTNRLITYSYYIDGSEDAHINTFNSNSSTTTFNLQFDVLYQKLG